MSHVATATVLAWADHLAVDPNKVDPEALRSELSGGTIPRALADSARGHPLSVLAIDGERTTHTDLHGRTARQASVLAHLGVARGDRVAINAPASMSLVVAYLAALHLGGVVVLTNPAYTSTELDALLHRSGASLLLVHDHFDRPSPIPVQRLSALAESTDLAREHPSVELTPEDVALLAFTSGTTGVPKGVPLTHGQLLASIGAAMRAWRWSSDDTLVHALPLFHQHGLSGIHASLLAGSNAVILAQFDPDELLDAIAREGATVLFAVPSIHQRLVDLDQERLAPLRGLRLVTSGSAPLSTALAEALPEKVGSLPLERYGLTETGLNLSNSYDGQRAVGTVGTPLPGVEVALTDPQGAPVADGAEGEIVLRGPQIFDGYLDDPEATEAAFWPGQWFRTGDLGRWDGQGRLTISGRLKDLVITGGLNVTPTEVEKVVEQLPGVREAAVAGLLSERWGEELAVWVVAEAGSTVSPEQVIAHCREHLAAYKSPKQVFYVETLPRNAMGKITRSKLTADPQVASQHP